jgi:hypothetical protein
MHPLSVERTNPRFVPKKCYCHPRIPGDQKGMLANFSIKLEPPLVLIYNFHRRNNDLMWRNDPQYGPNFAIGRIVNGIPGIATISALTGYWHLR